MFLSGSARTHTHTHTHTHTDIKSNSIKYIIISSYITMHITEVQNMSVKNIHT